MDVGNGTLEPLEKADKVALQPISKDQIIAIEDDLMEVVSSLRKMRQEWAEKKVPEVPLEIEKALRFADYLKNTWSHRVYSQFRQGAAKLAAQATREKISKKEK